MGRQQCSFTAKPNLGTGCANLLGSPFKDRHLKSRTPAFCSANCRQRQPQSGAERQWPSSAGRRPFLTGYGHLPCQRASRHSPYISGRALGECVPKIATDTSFGLQEREFWRCREWQKGPQTGATWYPRPSAAPRPRLPDLFGCNSPCYPGVQVCESIPSSGIPLLRPGPWPARVRNPVAHL